MVEDATKVLENVADELWVLWVCHIIPNVVHQVRQETEVRAHEEYNQKLREEAKCVVDEKLARAAKRDRQLEEKLTVVLEGQMDQAELEVNLEAEEMGEAEGSEAIRTEELGTMGGTQSSAMEVDEKGEDEVVVVEEMGAVITTQIVKEEGPSRDSDMNTGGESGQRGFGAGESDGDGDCSEHGEPMLEVCQALS